jgi:hypothetical protein
MATKVSLKTDAPKQQPLPAMEPDAAEMAMITGDHESQLPATLQKPPAFGEVTGEFDQSDIRIPKLEMVHGVGDLSEVFAPGDIIYNGELKLAGKGEPIHMSVLSIRKFYRESLPYDPDRDVMARIFATAEEVAAAGLTSEWDDKTPPTVDKVAEMRVAIECPEGVDRELFPICVQVPTAEGKTAVMRFALAVFTVHRTSYAPVAKQVFSAAAMTLKGKLPAGRWRLATLREKRGGNVVTVPSFRLISRYTDPVVDYFYSNLNWDK